MKADLCPLARRCHRVEKHSPFVSGHLWLFTASLTSPYSSHHAGSFHLSVVSETDRQTDTWTHIDTQTKRDRRTYGHTDRDTQTKTDRHMATQTEIHRRRQTDIWPHRQRYTDEDRQTDRQEDRAEKIHSLFVGCLTSQQHASLCQERIYSDNCMCCHTEIEVEDQTFCLTKSQYIDTGPTSPSADPTTPGVWQGSHWSANF